MHRLALFSLVSFSFALAGCDLEDFDGGGDRVQADFHYNYPMHAGGSVNVDTFNGSIEIIGWDQDSVDVSGTKYARTEQMRDAIKIDVMHSEGAVTVHTTRPFENQGNMGARFIIHVPKKANLDRIASSNGKISVRDVAGTANLKTSNGTISAEAIEGPVDASTSNGRITIQEALNSGRAPIHAKTSNGSIEITAEKPLMSDLHASTSNGSITVHLPPETAARLRASTSNSAITSDFDVTMQGRMDKHHLEGNINSPRGDAPVIELTTSNGHIRLAKL